MARRQFKWKFPFLLTILVANVLAKSIPIEHKFPSIVSSNTVFRGLVIPELIHESPKTSLLNDDTNVQNEDPMIINENNLLLNSSHVLANENDEVEGDNTLTKNGTIHHLARNVRPGQTIRNYNVEITLNGATFNGRVLIDVVLTTDLDAKIIFYCEDLRVNSLKIGIGSINNAVDGAYSQDDGLLEIETTSDVATTYVLSIEYTGDVRNDGRGIFRGEHDDNSYVGMNLFPTYARRVFPCMDELESSIVNFKFLNLGHNNIVSNSEFVENSNTDLLPLEVPLHLWSLVAHDFVNVNLPAANVHLYGRPGLSNQDAQASVTINYLFTKFNEWTEKDFFTIVNNQNPRFSIFAVPDSVKDWYGLSTLCIWEPYIYMENRHSIMQRKTSFVKIAEGIAKQWFGYVVYPTNWRFDWIISGLGSYVAYELLTEFQESDSEFDTTLIDMNAIFVSDIIQESLLLDSYDGALPLEPADDLIDENAIREYMHGHMKIKAAALMRSAKYIVNSPTVDHLQNAARLLLNQWSLQAITSQRFYDVLSGTGSDMPPNMNDEFSEYIEPYLKQAGYPVIHVRLINGGVLLTREHFSFGDRGSFDHRIPITYTTSANPDFSTRNVYPLEMIEASKTLSMSLGEEDWVLFNIQGQHYYRVDYEVDLWERIIETLEDPERRSVIHPLNRATLIDDALNHARAGRLDYDVAFRVVLTMEHETEYAPWKAFIRNMNFIKKHLNALSVEEDDDYPDDMYWRMVRRTVKGVEDQLGFKPDPAINEPAMDSLTRGIVMEHACQANYQPCIAAAVDWFWDPANPDVVNPDIPHDLRPAVYCTMVREGGDQAISALNDRLEIEQSHYERVVIVKSLGCSNNDNFIQTLLQETVANGNRYAVEERPLIFKSIAESSYDNSRAAMTFMTNNAARIRDMYGGPEALEEMMRVLADNMGNSASVTDFVRFITSVRSDLDDSVEMGERLEIQLQANNRWDTNHLDYVYNWIDENDASAAFLSLSLLTMSILISLLNI